MSDVKRLLGYLPLTVGEECRRICTSRGCPPELISEIRVRAHGVNSIVISSERVILSARCTPSELLRAFTLLCEGSVYAKRDMIREGYITLFDGIRVGICGQARYDGGELIGISEVSSLVFRIPTSPFCRADELYEIFLNVERGMLIYSPPGVGKTTALRSLSSKIGRVKSCEEVVVIDERCEFMPEDYENCAVDILRGYKREKGIEIALRTMSPTVIVVDEIGRSGEVAAMLESLNSGIRIIASAHASSFCELMNRRVIRPFVDAGVFDVFVGIISEGGKRSLIINGEPK